MHIQSFVDVWGSNMTSCPYLTMEQCGMMVLWWDGDTWSCHGLLVARIWQTGADCLSAIIHPCMGQMRVSGTILTPGKLLCQNTHCGKGPLMASNLKERSSVVLDHCYPLPHLTYLKLGEMEGVAVCERLLSFKMNAVCFKMLKEARGSEKEGDGNLVIVATHNSPADCPGWKFLCFVTNVMLRKPKQLGSKPLLTQGVKKLHTTKMVPSC